MTMELDKEELLRQIRAARGCCDWWADSDEIKVLKGYLWAAELQLRDSMPKKCCCECCCCKNRGQSCAHDTK